MPAKSAKVVDALRNDCLAIIQFLDHVECDSKPLPCTVYGRVMKVDDLSVTVICWAVGDEPDLADRVNNKYFCILKSAVTNVNLLIPIAA